MGSRSVMSDSLRPHELQHARPPVHHQLPEFTQTQVHQVSDAISHLILCRQTLSDTLDAAAAAKSLQSCPTLCQGDQLVLLAQDFPHVPGPLQSQTQGPNGSPSLAWLSGGEPRGPGHTTAPPRDSLPVHLQHQNLPTVIQQLPAAEGPPQTGRSSS